ncbi:MAG: hypothetical protein D6712_16830 [Chloroflexi bacterium]|nr:MAG: hypothetical protein D6712_16830 [Chloroflexota bacterium]
MCDLVVLLQEQREEEILRELSEREFVQVSGGSGGAATACLNHINPDPLNPIDCDLDDNLPIPQPSVPEPQPLPPLPDAC